MIETKKLLKELARRFPKKYAKIYHDYVGLMTGKLPEKLNRILLCLDFDHEVLPNVEEFKPDIIITHHPFIYGTKYQVCKRDEYKRNLVDKIDKMNIPVYSYHTNFDSGRGGMNDALAEALGLTNVYQCEKEICMRIGYLKEPMNVEDFAIFAKERFNVSYSLLINKGKEKVQKVGIIGGGGSRDYPFAIEEGCDIYISGDAPHHVRREINLLGFNYLDMPHEIEKIFMPTMKKILLEIDPTLEILTVDHEQLPKVI